MKREKCLKFMQIPYNILSFIGIVIGFVIGYFMLDMLMMVLATEPTLDAALNAYYEWIYLYIGTVSIFLIRHKFVIYINLIVLALLVIYGCIKNRKLGKECIVYALSSIYFIGANTFLEQYLDTTSTTALLDFVFSKMGIYMNILTFVVFVILLIVTIKGLKKLFRSNHTTIVTEVEAINDSKNKFRIS